MSAPSYRLLNATGGRYELTLVDAPPGCEALPAQADALPQLADGRWLVLAFAVWQATDHESVELALEVAAELGADRRRLGLLPFADHAELAPTGAAAREGSPIWLGLDGGQVVDERVGVQTWGELRELLR